MHKNRKELELLNYANFRKCWLQARKMLRKKCALSNDKKVNFPRRHTTQTHVYLTTEYQNMQGKPW